MSRAILNGLTYSALVFLSACSSTLSVSERTSTADKLASDAGFIRMSIATQSFELAAFGKNPNASSDVLIIYIEGDGYAWKSSSMPSDNPTPINPIALTLAVQDPRPAVVYLARPCQFTNSQSKNCNEITWTYGRFSQMVVNEMNEAIEILKFQYLAKNVILIGYSGGGAIATLVSAKRKDVQEFITVAGNLDTDVWVNIHGLDPLLESLNPVSVAKQLENVPQTHFIGGKDEVVPLAVTQSYFSKLATPNRAKVINFPNEYHHCCWMEHWKELILQK